MAVFDTLRGVSSLLHKSCTFQGFFFPRLRSWRASASASVLNHRRKFGVQAMGFWNTLPRAFAPQTYAIILTYDSDTQWAIFAVFAVPRPQLQLESSFSKSIIQPNHSARTQNDIQFAVWAFSYTLKAHMGFYCSFGIIFSHYQRSFTFWTVPRW